MNLKALEIQIYFEIAMAIGTSLDLRKMLHTALSAFLRKLICATGSVLELQKTEDGRYHFLPCFCIPRKAIDNPVYTAILDQIPEVFTEEELRGFINSLPLSGSINGRHHFHLTLLPGFGLLLLIRSGAPLDLRTLHSLRQLNRKLADSCLACRQSEKIEAMNLRLSREIEQRRSAENQLKELLGNLEQLVAERTSSLQESRMRYKNLFDNIQDIFFSLTPEGRIVEISPAVITILQQPRSGLECRMFCCIGTSRQQMEDMLREINTTGSVRNRHLEIMARDRTIHHFSMNATLTRDREGDPLQIVGSMRDITQLQLAEQSKRMLEEQLQTSRKMEALGLLAGGVAHDLNNVLSGIVSYPDLLLTMIDENSDLRMPITVIRDSGAKAAAIVQDLLTMARRGVVQKKVINLNRIVAEYLDSPEHGKLLGDHPGVRVTTELAPELLNLEGSPLHIKNAVMNLMFNSVEAGADHVVLSTENLYLEEDPSRVNCLPEGDYVVFRITDNGSGIAPEEQQRVFEPFYTKKVMGRSGTGLGMSVVWGTVQDHGGHIAIDSEPGRPTTIRLILPASRLPSAGDDTGEPDREYLGKGELVLVIDDSARQRHIARAALEALRYRVLTAGSGEQALRLLQKAGSLPDIILLDMIMEPGMDGLETYRRIRDLHPGQRVIIASGYAETDRVREAMRLGALLYLRKPYLMHAIGTALRQCLEPGPHAPCPGAGGNHRQKGEKE